LVHSGDQQQENRTITDPARGRPAMKKQIAQSQVEEAPRGMSLETIIAVGVFGWMALGVVMMGLGIW
jgi:hypothetical protein